MNHAQSPYATLVPILVVFAVLALRMRRMSGTRTMQLKALWIRPAILFAVACVLVSTFPPHGLLQVLILVAAVGAGALLGWHQGKLMTITLHPEDGTLQVKASTLAIVIFMAVILLRIGLRPWLTGETSPFHAYVGVITDAFLLFIVGLATAQAAEMFIRGRALLAAARAIPGG